MMFESIGVLCTLVFCSLLFILCLELFRWFLYKLIRHITFQLSVFYIYTIKGLGVVKPEVKITTYFRFKVGVVILLGVFNPINIYDISLNRFSMGGNRFTITMPKNKLIPIIDIY